MPEPEPADPLFATRLKLRRELHLRLDENGAIRVWLPSSGSRSMNVNELEFIQLLAPGATPADAASLGGFEQAEVLPFVRVLLENGIVEPERAATTIPREQPTTPEGCPIFLLGCPRSGTTLVRWIVDSHSRIHCPSETRLLTDLHQLVRHGKSLRLLRALGFTQREVLSRLVQPFNDMMAEVTARAGKQRWAEKSPQNSLIAEFIHDAYAGNCRFVIIVRHALDVADSFATARKDRWGVGMEDLFAPGDEFDLPLLSGARMWARYSEHLRHFRDLHEDSCFVLRYEDLVAEPERVSADLFAFLGEELEPGLLDAVFRLDHGKGAQDSNILGTTRIEKERAGRWKRWPAKLSSGLAQLVEQELEAWGYQTP